MCQILLFLIIFVSICTTSPVVVNRKTLPNIDALFCNNTKFRDVIVNLLQNLTDPNSIAVDELQADIEKALQPTFVSSGGIWLVSVTSYHRVNGYVDDRAGTMDTFCALNDVHLNLYVVVTKVE